ncbi:hypothetical protein HOK00_10390 [bacterium]|nr:hypothetical protein [bacterium]
MYILFGIVFLLISNIFRFNDFSFEQTYIVLFSMLGEFIMPNISTFYLINNPLHFDSLFAIQDLYFQLLPSSVRPSSELYAFRDYYLSRSIDPWPIGGIYFLGQFYFYFGIFYIFILIGLIKYLIEIQNILINRKFSLLLLLFPMLVMILPRMELWTLRNSIFSMVFFIITFLLIKIISTKRNK